MLTAVHTVGNANCASTCAMFSTLMNERHNTKIAIFGGQPDLSIPMQFKGAFFLTSFTHGRLVDL